MVSSLQKGISAAKAGRMQAALDFLKDAIIEEPQNAEVWVWVAAIIDDLDKQEIFLKKALEIDPRNIPAQRGLAYLRKRRQDQSTEAEDRLSDHTSPISPFPSSGQPKPSQTPAGRSKLDLSDIDEIAAESKDHSSGVKSGSDEGFFKDLPKLTPLEIALLSVVVLVFCFIGLLAASALFYVDLPFNLADRGPRSSELEPPYSGLFIYESEGEKFLNIPMHQGLPSTDEGMPTSAAAEPMIIVWDKDVHLDQLNLIYETGVYVPFSISNLRKDLFTITLENDLQTGLYCFQQLPIEPSLEAATYWCFKINPAAAE